MHKKYHKKIKILDIIAVTTQAREGIETFEIMMAERLFSVTTQRLTCQTPAKKYKLYKSSINKSLHFAQRRLSSSTRE